MILENLAIGPIAMHEVLKRGEDKKPLTPLYGSSLEVLPAKALSQFRLRVTEALSAQSKSIEMKIVETGEGSVVALAVNRVLLMITTHFSTAHVKVANRNSCGVTVGARHSRWSCNCFRRNLRKHPRFALLELSKPKSSPGFRRHGGGKRSITEFLDDIFLTPAQRLYKIGFLVHSNPSEARADAWRAIVFDSNMSVSHR